MEEEEGVAAMERLSFQVFLFHQYSTLSDTNTYQDATQSMEEVQIIKYGLKHLFRIKSTIIANKNTIESNQVFCAK